MTSSIRNKREGTRVVEIGAGGNMKTIARTIKTKTLFFPSALPSSRRNTTKPQRKDAPERAVGINVESDGHAGQFIEEVHCRPHGYDGTSLDEDGQHVEWSIIPIDRGWALNATNNHQQGGGERGRGRERSRGRGRGRERERQTERDRDRGRERETACWL